MCCNPVQAGVVGLMVLTLRNGTETLSPLGGLDRHRNGDALGPGLAGLLLCEFFSIRPQIPTDCRRNGALRSTVIAAVYEVLIRDSDDGRRWPVKPDRNHITNQKVTRRMKKSPRTSDPIRIVPLHLPSELYRPSAGIAAPPVAQLAYRGGPLLASVKVFSLLWGRWGRPVRTLAWRTRSTIF